MRGVSTAWPRRRLVRVLFLVAASWCLPATATDTQDAAREASTPGLDQLVEEAIRLRRRGMNEQALERLSEARSRYPGSLRVQVHWAAALQAVGRWLEAEEALSKVLSERSAPYVKRNLRLIEDALHAVRQHIGALQIVGEPAGASVQLDGLRVGTLPLSTPIRVLSGPHTLQVEQTGYQPLLRRIEVPARQSTRETVLLERLPHEVDEPRQPRDASVPPDGSGVVWMLAGAAGAFAVTGAVTWGLHHQHAARYNGNTCLRFGRTREELCGADRDAAQRYGAMAALSGGASVALGAAALAWGLWEGPRGATREPADEDITGCGISLLGVLCSGRF